MWPVLINRICPSGVEKVAAGARFCLGVLSTVCLGVLSIAVWVSSALSISRLPTSVDILPLFLSPVKDLFFSVFGLGMKGVAFMP